MIKRSFLISIIILVAGFAGFFASGKLMRLSPEMFYPSINTEEQETEFNRLLDYYMQLSTNYYQWIEHGNAQSKSSFLLSMGQFKSVLEHHEQTHDDPWSNQSLNIDEAKALLRMAEHTASSVRWSRVVVVITFFLLILGIPGAIRKKEQMKFAGTLYFDTLFRPHKISNLTPYHGTRRLAIFMLVLYVLGFMILTGFDAFIFPLIVGAWSLGFILLLSWFIGRGKHFVRIFISVMSPHMVIMGLVLIFVAIRGPAYFWFQVWTSDLMIGLFLSLFFIMLFQKIHVYTVITKIWSGRTSGSSVGLVLMIFGLQLASGFMILYLYGLENSLTLLNSELHFLPGGILSSLLG